MPDGSHLVILIDGQGGAIASEPIAQTAAIAAGQMSYQLQSVEVGPTGTSYGTPQGWATVAYDPQARTITVTLTASGLTPGAHAAHIHVGSCASQGPVQYMLMDFMANSQGPDQRRGPHGHRRDHAGARRRLVPQPAPGHQQQHPGQRAADGELPAAAVRQHLTRPGR